MRNLTEANLTDAVLAQTRGCEDERTRRAIERVIFHLHAIVREVQPTPDEWLAAIRFLTETGKICDTNRQEFILLSDVLGISMLVDAIDNRRTAGGTESSVLGPFYVEGAPRREHGTDMAADESGSEAATFRGRVLDPDGKPIEGALLDVWETAPNGLYDIQDPAQPRMHLRGKFQTGPDGRYEFHTLKPVSYPIPTDGPVGKLLAILGREPYRPAHMHFIVSAAGYKRLVTELFAGDDPHLDRDPVFGVKNSLVVEFRRDGRDARGRPHSTVEFDFVLEPSRSLVMTEVLKNPTVKATIDALQRGDETSWSAHFERDATLYDDGSPRSLEKFTREALGHERFTSIDRVSADGLEVVGAFHSDRWGDFKTYFRFELSESGKIKRLDIGQAE